MYTIGYSPPRSIEEGDREAEKGVPRPEHEEERRRWWRRAASGVEQAGPGGGGGMNDEEACEWDHVVCLYRSLDINLMFVPCGVNGFFSLSYFFWVVK